MKQFFYISVVLFLLLLVACSSDNRKTTTTESAAKSVDAGKVSAKKERTKKDDSAVRLDKNALQNSREFSSDEIEEEAVFERSKVPTFSAIQQVAFTEKAAQQFRDLVEYTKIIADPMANRQIRKQAAKMSRALFEDAAVLQIDETNQLSIDLFIKQLQGRKRAPFSDIERIETLTETNALTGRGALQIYFEDAESLRLDFRVISQIKQFGNRQQQVQKVVFVGGRWSI